jgi:hypothetical protein
VVDYGELLDRMVITVTSPDGNIRATINNAVHVDVEFLPGAFPRYDEYRLGQQLARLGVNTFIGFKRGRTEAYRRSYGLSAEEAERAGQPSTDPRRLRYEEELDRLRGEGRSTGGVIHVSTIGMLRWAVEIRPGSIHRLGEERFLAEIHSALDSLLTDRQVKIIMLKAEHFDLGIPKPLLEQMRRIQAMKQRSR